MPKSLHLVLITIGALTGAAFAVIAYQLGENGTLIITVAVLVGGSLILSALRPKQCCSTCGGQGRLNDHLCSTCNGKGQL